MKQILITTLMTLILIPCVSFAQDQEEEMQQQTSAIDRLIKGYEVAQRRPVEPEDKDSEIRRLRSQLIDVRVERDQLADEVLFLKQKIQNMEEAEEAHPGCENVECIPITQVEQDKIITHVIYTISQYRMAEYLTLTVPAEYVRRRGAGDR